MTAGWCVLVALVAVSCTRFKSDQELEESFQADGFRVVQKVTYNGNRGFGAESLTSTVLSTGLPKKVYYVEGSSYEMGYILGLMTEGDASAMCEVYLAHILPDILISDTWDKKMESSLWRGLYDKVLHLLMKIYHIAVSDFERQSAVFPAELVEELRGLADGALAANSSTKVTYSRLVELNYGIDYVMSHIYAGSLAITLNTLAQEDGSFSNEELTAMATLTDTHYFKVPVYCSGLSVKGAATLSGKDVFFARDFQLPTGLVFQNLQYMVIYNPSDCSRLPLVSASAPGFVGAITAVNSKGLAMSVDVLATGEATPKSVGLNSCLLVRHVVDTHSTTDAAIATVANARRGVSWIYPICDAAGEGVVLEAGVYSTSPQEEQTLHYVTNRGLLPLLPSADFLEKYSTPEYHNGVFVRRMNYSQPLEFLRFNEKLFERAGVAYNASAWGVGGELFPSFEAEREVQHRLMSNYFAPQREEFDDVVAVTNNAYVPQMRVAQMSLMGDYMAKGAAVNQWRYDLLMKEVAAVHGTFDFDKMKRTITYLSPDRVPGYWDDRWDASDPMSAVVEGSITVADLRTGRIATLGGYYKDDWIELLLPRYFNDDC